MKIKKDRPEYKCQSPENLKPSKAMLKTRTWFYNDNGNEMTIEECSKEQLQVLLHFAIKDMNKINSKLHKINMLVQDCLP